MPKYYFVSYKVKKSSNCVGMSDDEFFENVIIKDIHPLIWISMPDNNDKNNMYSKYKNYILFYNEIAEDVAIEALKTGYIDRWGF